MFLCKTAKEDTVEARVESVQVGTTHMTNARLCLKQQNRHRLWVTETHPQVQVIGCGSHCCLSLSLGAFGMLQTCRETVPSSQDKTTSWTKQQRAPFHLSKRSPSPIKEQVLRFRWTPEPRESSCAAGKLSGEEAGAWVVGPQQQLLFFHSTDLLDALKSCNVTWTLKCVWVYDISFSAGRFCQIRSLDFSTLVHQTVAQYQIHTSQSYRSCLCYSETGFEPEAESNGLNYSPKWPRMERCEESCRDWSEINKYTHLIWQSVITTHFNKWGLRTKKSHWKVK